jgi:hypothetical protein
MSVGSPPARPTPPDASVFNRILMLLVPDATATGIGIGLVAVFFAAGFLEMLSKHYAEAESYFYLAFGMMAFLITMKYLSLRANHMVAQASHQNLIKRLRQHQLLEQNSHRIRGLTAAERAQAVQAKVEERKEMLRVADTLKEALKHIDREDPRRPKYEASIKMMEKIIGRESS